MKDVQDFIKSHRPAFSSDDAFKTGVRKLVEELNEFPDENKHQLKFFNDVLSELCNLSTPMYV